MSGYCYSRASAVDCMWKKSEYLVTAEFSLHLGKAWAWILPKEFPVWNLKLHYRYFEVFYTACRVHKKRLYIIRIFDTLSVIQVIYIVVRRVSAHSAYHLQGLIKIVENLHGLQNCYNPSPLRNCVEVLLLCCNFRWFRHLCLFVRRRFWGGVPCNF